MKRTVTTVEIVERVVISAAHTDTVRPPARSANPT